MNKRASRPEAWFEKAEPGANIVAEYRMEIDGPRFDVSSAGSGFQQVLMLLAMLNTRPGSVLLLDEPDAHLHIMLQDAIYGELRAVAASTKSQLIVATHSEVIINAVDARELCVLLDRPVMLADDQQRLILIQSLRALSNDDIMRALEAPGVLYLEGHTDLEILRAFARVLEHPADRLLTPNLFWKATVADTQLGARLSNASRAPSSRASRGTNCEDRPFFTGGAGLPGACSPFSDTLLGRPGIKARDHYDALCMVKTVPGLEVIDGDSHPSVQSTAITGTGLQRRRWGRYEIESYLIHPAALERFVTNVVGVARAAQHVADLYAYLNANLPPAVIERPLDGHPYLNNTKARTDILPPALNAAGLPNLPYTRYHEIASGMLPAEVHPDVVQMLDTIVAAFGQ